MGLMDNNVALLVHSCDRYEFLYKGFEFFFTSNWDNQINCTCYFATEEIKTDIQGFRSIQSGRGPWADRLAFLLKEKIKEPYVLYFQEDMWITKRINPVFFNELFRHAKKNNWVQIKLHSSDVYKTMATELYIEGFNVAEVDNLQSDFLMSHQVTLWDREFLIKQLHKNEHPWRNERKGTKRLKKLNPKIYHIDYFAENGAAAINLNDKMVLRSEYKTVSVNSQLNNNIEYFISELNHADTEMQGYAQKLQFNYTHQITHDGKPKPRKVDIFKKIKNLIQGK